MSTPAFCYPKQFSQISGRSIKEIRKMCKVQIIPNEKTKHGYRIDVSAALEVLKNRASEFEGHEYIFIAKPQSVKSINSRKGLSFLEALDKLKKAR